MKKSALRPFDWFIIVGTILSVVLYSVFALDLKTAIRDLDWWIAAASVINIFCVVLCAKGLRLNFVFGFVYNILYAWYCIRTNHYGNALVYGLYFLPMQVVGYIQWKKVGTTGESNQVAARRLSPKMRWIGAVASLVIAAGVCVALHFLGGKDAEVDAFVTVLCVAAQLLLTFAYAEQWIIWILVNVFTVAMWVLSALRGNGTPYDPLIVITYFFTLLNSLNGLRVWLKLSAK